RSIGYLSDESGEHHLDGRCAGGKGKAKAFPLNGGGFFPTPVWSPDGNRIGFVDNTQSLYCIDLTDGKVKKVASEPHYGPTMLLALRPAWSPDSKWLVYALGNNAAYRTGYAYEVATGKSPAR